MKLIEFSKRLDDLVANQSLAIAYSKASTSQRETIDAEAIAEDATAESLTQYMMQIIPKEMQRVSSLFSADASDLSQYSQSEKEEFEKYMNLAYEQAKTGFQQKGVPIVRTRA